jgi:hypothetical protein
MPDPVPQYFSDTFEFSFSPYGLAIAFGLRPVRPEQEGPIDVAVVRMSLEQAKILSMLLRKKLNQYEQATGAEISIPGDVYQQLDLDADEWRLPAGG